MSVDLFVSFLCNRQPFAKDFGESLARDFYSDVRCGLLHEAQTKNGWKILAHGPGGSVVNREERIVFRDDFQDGLLEFINRYRVAVLSEMALQEAFIRKFNSLCG